MATGLAFDTDGSLYVGDRQGTVFKISPSRQIFVFATLEPSIASLTSGLRPGSVSLRRRTNYLQLRLRPPNLAHR